MVPMIGLLMAHGTAALLQFPVLGLVLAAPTLLVFAERLTRILNGFHKIPTNLEVLDEEIVRISCTTPQRRLWCCKTGQYVFLQVPQISFFQWHPFTISTYNGREMQLHIKKDGDWTGKLRELRHLDFVGIDGPCGAPAQRFYDFDQAITVGAGIGVTLSAGTLNDLQESADLQWHQRRDSTTTNESIDRPENAPAPSSNNDTAFGDKRVDLEKYRRVDFHWIVRDKNYLLWFSDVLNETSSESPQRSPNLLHPHPQPPDQEATGPLTTRLPLAIRKHRTEAQPMSPLSGLIEPTYFGRPNFPKILNEHYDEMARLFNMDQSRKRKVGVFFCAAPVIGHALADLCH